MNYEPQTQSLGPGALPETISRYLTAHRARDTSTAISAFAGDAVVIDEGITHTGTAAIERWLTESATRYTYTTEVTGTKQIDESHFVVHVHLEGNFPGGQVDLRYQFTLRDGLIGSLTIEL
jgi:ketosteroid isomerase-like protein